MSPSPINSEEDRAASGTNLLEQSVVKIKEEIDTFDYDEHTMSSFNKNDYSVIGIVSNITLATDEPNIVNSSTPMDEIDIKDEITFEEYQIQEQPETKDDDDDGQISKEYETTATIKLEKDDTDFDELELDQDEDITEEIEIKTEITVEEAKVEKYTEFEKNRRKFECNRCDYRCANRKTLGTHFNIAHSEDNTTRCLICYKKFIGTCQLKEHIEDAHQGLGSRCIVCSAQYKKGEWDKHKAKCPGQLVYSCNTCEENYLKKEGLFKHLDEHGVKEDLKGTLMSELRVNEPCYCCIICDDDKAYKIGAIRTHAKELHEGRYLHCPDCRKTFRDAGSRSNHMKKYCQVGPAREKLKKEYLECPECSKPCQNRTALENHLVSNHPKEPRQCNVCKMSFSSSGMLRYHKVRVHSEPSLSCSYCPRQFHWRSSLRYHILFHENQTVTQQKCECQKCFKQFTRQAYLKKHMRLFCKGTQSSTQSTPRTESVIDEEHQIKHKIVIDEVKIQENPKTKTFSCKFCEFSSGCKTLLRYHVKKNHPENGVSRCSICHLQFQGMSQLDKHIADEHQGLGNKCNICSAQYAKGAVHRSKCLGCLLHKCDKCEILYLKKEGLLKHLDEHGVSEDLKESSICDIRIKEQFFSCEICEDDKAYRKNTYDKHIKDKHFGRRLQCPHCRKTFNSTSSRNNHFVKVCKIGLSQERVNATVGSLESSKT